MTNLVMIPAFGCDERLYAEIAPLLPSNVLSSTVIADGPDFATCVDQVLAQAPEQFVVLGTSFGGRVALETASVAPDRVSALVLLCAAAPGVAPTPDAESFDEEEERLLGAGDLDGAVELNVRTWLGPSADESARALVREMQARAFELDTAAEELSPAVELRRPELDLAALTMPALVVSGDHDLLFFRETARHLAEHLPAAELVSLDWAGHLPSLERPDETAALVTAHLDRVLLDGQTTTR